MIDILIVGTHQQIMETIARLINKEGKWKATIANSLLAACSVCKEKDFGLALIGAGLSDEEESQLKQTLTDLKPDLPIVKHYGGGSGLLFAEIYQALAS